MISNKDIDAAKQHYKDFVAAIDKAAKVTGSTTSAAQTRLSHVEAAAAHMAAIDVLLRWPSASYGLLSE